MFDALSHEFDSVFERKCASVFLDNENIKASNFRRRVFDEILMTERERIAIHDDCADWSSLLTELLFVSLKLRAVRILYAALLELRWYTITVEVRLTGGGGYLYSTSRKKLFAVKNLKYFSATSL